MSCPCVVHAARGTAGIKGVGFGALFARGSYNAGSLGRRADAYRARGLDRDREATGTWSIVITAHAKAPGRPQLVRPYSTQ